MRSRAWLVGVVVAGVGTAAVLFLWPRSTGHDSAPPPVARPVSGDASARGAGTGDRTAAQSPAADGGQREADDGPRDHRGETPSQPRRHRPGEKVVYVVQAPVIADLRKAVRPQIERCSQEFGRDLAPGAQIQGALEVTVRSGLLSVVNVKMEQRGVPESSGLIECARKAFAALELRADGHPDVASHVLRFPFKVPIK